MVVGVTSICYMHQTSIYRSSRTICIDLMTLCDVVSLVSWIVQVLIPQWGKVKLHTAAFQSPCPLIWSGYNMASRQRDIPGSMRILTLIRFSRCWWWQRWCLGWLWGGTGGGGAWLLIVLRRVKMKNADLSLKLVGVALIEDRNQICTKKILVQCMQFFFINKLISIFNYDVRCVHKRFIVPTL